jgi:hypothetical protein
MVLPAPDAEYLSTRSAKHEVSAERGMTCLVLQGFPLPPGYDRTEADLLVRLPAGYPDIPPDMWWFDPPVRLASGASAPATEHSESHLGRTWQRWSRHLKKEQWQSGVDGLESFLALIGEELRRCANGA